MTTYNPYDMVPVLVDEVETMGRPIELNGDISDTNTMTDVDGKLVVPSKLSIMCPKCGAGYIIPVVLHRPPFPMILATCGECTKHLNIPPLEDPWVVPHKVVALRNFKAEVAKAVVDDKCTVAERMARRQKVQMAKPAQAPKPEPVRVNPVVEAVIAEELVPEPIVEPMAEDVELMNLLNEFNDDDLTSDD